ncbi:MAG: hypothetical protein GSR72_07610 [Desulfurococcales archaeon]|nr:hypothetical protein [Desulfurococcales archaeon]
MKKLVISVYSRLDEREVKQLLNYLEKYKQIELYPTNNLFNINYYFKGIGLFLTDGYYYKYKIIKNTSKLKKIELQGLNEISAIAFLRTYLKISQRIVVTHYRNPMNVSGTYFSVRVYPVSRTFFELLNHIRDKPCRFLQTLEYDNLLWLFSGIIEGDGYIGKNYLSISYKESTEKGKIIECILKTLEKRGMITLKKYYGYPKYEHVFTLNNGFYADFLSHLIYINKKLYRLINIAKNKTLRQCKLEDEDLGIIDRYFKSSYIDHRRSEKRSPILVIYLETNPLTIKLPGAIIRKDNRIMLKISSSCAVKLLSVVKNDKLRKTINDYLSQ